jgi:hypothetical protein
MTRLALPELIDAFERTRQALLQEAASVPPALRTTPFVGHWDLHDLLAHLVGWDHTNLESIDDMQAGRLPVFYAHYESNWDAFNAVLVTRHRDDDWDRLIRSIRASGEAVIARLRSLPGEPPSVDWDGRRITLRGVLSAAVRDEQEHLDQVRRLKQSGMAPTLARDHGE